MNTITKRLRRTPWHIYLPLLALLLWAMIGAFYLGLCAAGRQPAEVEAAEVETMQVEQTQLVSVLTAAPSVEDDPSYTEEDLETLALIIYQEAGGDACSDDTRLKVGTVVLNRVASDIYPDTIQEVALQRAQYGRLYWTGLEWPERASLPQEARAVARAYDCAEQLLIGDRALPSDVIYQAEFVQGTEVVAHQDGLYFCR